MPYCCSEAGTLALSRPDIAAAMLERKRSALAPQFALDPMNQLLTNCPACLNGLSRLGLVAPKHLAVALADACAPKDWRHTTVQHLKRAELIRI